MLLRRRSSQWAVLSLAWASIYLGSLFTPAFFDDADSIHAVAARGMALRGDWVTLYIDGIRYLEKAPLLYWASGLSAWLFGDGEWALRLPIALAALALTALVYGFGKRVGGERAGFYSALVYVTALGPYAFTRILLPDVLLTLFLSACFSLYLQILQEPDPPRRLLGRWDPRALGLFASMALAVLTKGLVGCVFAAGVIFVHLAVSGRWDVLKRLQILPGLAVFVLVAAPWHIAAGIANKGFFWFYFVNEHFLRYLGLRYPKDYDTVPRGLFWALHLVWLFPWTFYALGLGRTLPRSFRPADRQSQANLFLWLWVLVILVFFSFSTTQEYYTFPTLPAFALLLGQVLALLESPSGETLRKRALAGLAVLAALGLVTGAALVFVAKTGIAGAAPDVSGTLTFNPDRYALSFGHLADLTPATFARLFPLVAATALLSGAGPLLALVLAVRRRWTPAALCLAATMVGLLHCYHRGMVAFEPVLSSRGLARTIEESWKPGDEIVINGRYERGSSLNYYTGNEVHILNGRNGNLWYGSYFPDAPALFLDDASFLRLWGSGDRVFFFSEDIPLSRFLGRHPSFRYRTFAQEGGKTLLVNW